MAKLPDIQKDEGNDSIVNFVITTMVCKDPWGRLVRHISFKKSDVHACVIRKLFLPMISALTNEPPVQPGGIRTRSLARG